MTRHQRLQVKIRRSPERQFRQTRNRAGRHFFRRLAVSWESCVLHLADLPSLPRVMNPLVRDEMYGLQVRDPKALIHITQAQPAPRRLG